MLDILAVTYNVNRFPVSQDLTPLFVQARAPHIVAFGLQEATTRMFPYADQQVVNLWQSKIYHGLQRAFPLSPYDCVNVVAMSGVVLFLFCQIGLTLSDVQSAVCPVGPMLLPTKGAVGVSFQVQAPGGLWNDSRRGSDISGGDHLSHANSISVCIVDAHLTHGQKPTKRNANYRDVCARLVFTRKRSHSHRQGDDAAAQAVTVTEDGDDNDDRTALLQEHRNAASARSSDTEEQTLFDHDYVIFMGDLNYRLDPTAGVTASDIHDRVNACSRESLMPFDQLRAAQQSGAVFAQFDEAHIDFLPTYKTRIAARSPAHMPSSSSSSSSASLPGGYQSVAEAPPPPPQPGATSGDYDVARIPGFTDRVLVFSPLLLKTRPTFIANIVGYTPEQRARAGIRYYQYRSHPDFVQSDHKPVSLLFSIGNNKAGSTNASRLGVGSSSSATSAPADGAVRWTTTDLAAMSEYGIDAQWRKKLKRGMRNAQIAERRNVIGLVAGLTVLLVFVGCATMALGIANARTFGRDPSRRR
ncbi:hypothetical protein RI367_002854 [Sorochytrium milnesiophthora]